MLNLLMSDPALLNGLWGGSELMVDRKASESTSVENPRLTLMAGLCGLVSLRRKPITTRQRGETVG